MNPVAHYDGTAEEILRDTDGKASFKIFLVKFYESSLQKIVLLSFCSYIFIFKISFCWSVQICKFH